MSFRSNCVSNCSQEKCSANSLTKAYNWLTELNFTPRNFLNLSQEQLKKHLKLVNDLTSLTIKNSIVSVFVPETFNRAR